MATAGECSQARGGVNAGPGAAGVKCLCVALRGCSPADCNIRRADDRCSWDCDRHCRQTQHTQTCSTSEGERPQPAATRGPISSLAASVPSLSLLPALRTYIFVMNKLTSFGST